MTFWQIFPTWPVCALPGPMHRWCISFPIYVSSFPFIISFKSACWKKVPSQFHALVGPCFKAGILWQIGPAYMACICMVNCQAKCIDDLSPINPVLYFWFIISNMWIHCIDSQFCAHWQAARMHWWFIAWPTLPQRNIGQQYASFHSALQCSFFQFCSTLFLPPSTRQGPLLTLKVGWWTRPPSTQITHKYSTAVYPAVFRTAAPCQHFKWDW